MTEDRFGPVEQPRLGSLFGRFRLDAVVGRGGMGVVFRATDVTLDRPVALKLLSPELAADRTFRARFERESRLAAAIEHPSIVPVYDAGAVGDTLFIAMRYVPGRDLGTILRLEAPLALERTLAISRQLAAALDAANRRGLVHRDVKPANVLVEQDGTERVFLADFGLTHRLGEATLTTRSGPLGTIDYIAPEQVEGRPVDGRTDQYGLACVVVHCLTGSPPFSGDSDASILYAHVHTEPSLVSTKDPRIPPAARAAIARALAKAPDARFPDCGAFVAALGAGETSTAAAARARATPAETPPMSAEPTDPPTTIGGARRRHPLAIGAVLGVVILVVAGALLAAPPSPQGPSEPVETAASPDAGRVRPALLGPAEGEVIYFASDADGDYDLYALEPGRARPRQLTRTTRNERQPAVSPDGRTIAYVVGDDPGRDIWLMDSDGSDPRALVRHVADDTDPAWSEDGMSLAFASRRDDPVFDIYEIRDRGDGLRERAARNLTRRAAVEQHPDWAPAIVRPSGRTTATRALAIASNHHGEERDIFVIDSGDADTLIRLTTSGAYDQNPDWSPDRATIAFDRRPTCATCVLGRGTADLYAFDLASRRVQRLTDAPTRDDVQPDWAPDGRAIAYSSGRPGAMRLFATTPDGKRRRPLTDPSGDAIHPAWSRTPIEDDTEAPPSTAP